MSLLDDQKTTISLAEFLGPDKKYKTEDDVAKALIEKDNFIERLKAEAEEARRAVRTAPVADRSQEILDQLDALKTSRTTESQPTTATERVTEPKGLSESDIERVLTERENRLRAQANISQAKQDLKAKFGDKYTEVLNTIAKENGLTVDDFEGIAARSPAALMKFFGEVKPDVPFTPPTSAVTPGFAPTAGVHQKQSFYEKLKVTDRNSYFSAKTQSQMYKDAMALKEEFYDTP
jgi:hypothetical protein